jgi:hypothetical protein
MTEPSASNPQSWWRSYPTGRARVFAVVVSSVVAVGCSVALGLRVSNEGTLAHEVLGFGRMGGILHAVMSAFGPRRRLWIPAGILAVIVLVALEHVLRKFS